MELELSKKQLRRLIDMVYIGNWVLNSMRGAERFADYDQIEALLLRKAKAEGMEVLTNTVGDKIFPSKAFVEGGIHNAIAEYEGFVFFDILAEDLTRRDMGDAEISPENYYEFVKRMEEYMEEFDEYGTDHVNVDWDSENNP